MVRVRGEVLECLIYQPGISERRSFRLCVCWRCTREDSPPWKFRKQGELTNNEGILGLVNDF